MLEKEFVPPKSALDIFVKDMGLVRQAAEEQGFETPLSSAALELYLAGKEAGLGTEDDSGVIRVLRRRMAST
jgi:3-hydroxyisobutyrate dehydrogenase-like beta-hydroxyacid dehydrogenase